MIRKGETSTVHIALCRRGRLRGRKVAMKQASIPLSKTCMKLLMPLKIDRKSGSSQSLAHLKISTTVHLSLHHPAIVSLFSSFSSATHDYHVMELCSRGTLFSFLQSRATRVLSECEVRGVSKSLIEALIYLRKELIVHRDINPTNLLITVDYRIVRLFHHLKYIFVDVLLETVRLWTCDAFAIVSFNGNNILWLAKLPIAVISPFHPAYASS